MKSVTGRGKGWRRLNVVTYEGDFGDGVADMGISRRRVEKWREGIEHGFILFIYFLSFYFSTTLSTDSGLP